MAPGEFGLSYEIFVVNEVITLTSTILQPPSPTVGARQAQTSIPGACYPWCNNCLLEAQANGKTSALCIPGSAFDVSLQQCEECIDVHKSDDSGSFVQIAPQFQQFLDFCDQYSTVVVSTSVTATTTNGAGSVSTVLSSTLSTTVTPRSSAPPSSSPGPHTSVTTIVATTATATAAPYTTTSTVLTTSYSESTVTGTDWSQVTIIMPIGDNITTTIYGSDVSSGATLVLPEAANTSSYLTTLTVTPGSEVSTASTTVSGTASSSALASASASVSATASQFPGAASALRSSSGNVYWRTIGLGLAISLIIMLLP